MVLLALCAVGFFLAFSVLADFGVFRGLWVAIDEDPFSCGFILTLVMLTVAGCYAASAL